MKWDFSKNKKVDRLLTKQGILSSNIYYSSIINWLGWYIVIWLKGVGLLALLVLFISRSSLEWIIILHFIISYLLAMYLGNSIALSSKSIYIVNPYFLFKKTTRINFSEIKSIEISDKKQLRYLFYSLLIVGREFIKIETRSDRAKVYCVDIDRDYFERENFENTIEDLHNKLKNKGIMVQSDLD